MPDSVDSLFCYKALERNAVRVATYVKESSCFRSLRSVKAWVGSNVCLGSSQSTYSPVSREMDTCPPGYRRFDNKRPVNPVTRIMADTSSSDEEIDVSPGGYSQNNPVSTQPESRQPVASSGELFSGELYAEGSPAEQQNLPDVTHVYCYSPEGAGLESLLPLGSIPPLPEEMQVKNQSQIGVSIGNKPVAAQIRNSSTGERQPGGDWGNTQGIPTNTSKGSVRQKVIDLWREDPT